MDGRYGMVYAVTCGAGAGGRSSYYGNGGSGPDQVNVNEQIFINKPEKGAWKVNHLLLTLYTS